MTNLPKQIPAGTKVIALSLANGTMAVKVSKFNEDGDQLYGIHTKEGLYLNELITIEECQFRKLVDIREDKGCL